MRKTTALFAVGVASFFSKKTKKFAKKQTKSQKETKIFIFITPVKDGAK